MVDEVRNEKRLKRLSANAVKNVERAMKELCLEWHKDELVDTGIINTSRLRHIIQSIKDLKDIDEQERNMKNIVDASKIYQALEKEDDN